MAYKLVNECLIREWPAVSSAGYELGFSLLFKIKPFWKQLPASLNHLLRCSTSVSLLNLVGLILWGTIPFCYFVFRLKV